MFFFDIEITLFAHVNVYYYTTTAYYLIILKVVGFQILLLSRSQRLSVAALVKITFAQWVTESII